MASMSFDNMVKLYEETRVFDLEAFNSALDFLVEKYPPRMFPKLFEPGIGTGRIAIPLAHRGYNVTGIDISQEMLKCLEYRLQTRRDDLSIFYGHADVTNLPFPNMTFDIVIAVHLFYFIKEWKQAVNEILRTLNANGKLVLMHTGTGTEILSLNQRYKELCAINGYTIEDIGVQSTREVIDYLTEIGYNTEEIRGRWRWIQKVTLGKAIEYIRSRAYSFTMVTPDDVHRSVIEKLMSELKQQHSTMNMEIEIPNQIYYVFASCK